jgi:hypothetical protein
VQAAASVHVLSTRMKRMTITMTKMITTQIELVPCRDAERDVISRGIHEI